jgi:hypothetical protein
MGCDCTDADGYLRPCHCEDYDPSQMFDGPCCNCGHRATCHPSRVLEATRERFAARGIQ